MVESSSEVRILIRIANSSWSPRDATLLIRKVRLIAEPQGGKAINLRVSSKAIEFDLFVRPPFLKEAWKGSLAPLGEWVDAIALEEPVPGLLDDALIRKAQALSREERYWEVHEVLEVLWRKATGIERTVLQAFILAAAAFVHFQKDENEVGWRMLRDVQSRLSGAPEVCLGLAVRELRASIERMLDQQEVKFLSF